MYANISKTAVIRHVQPKYNTHKIENVILMLHTGIIFGWRRDALSTHSYFINAISKFFPFCLCWPVLASRQELKPSININTQIHVRDY